MLLKLGDSGNAVKVLQADLNKLGSILCHTLTAVQFRRSMLLTPPYDGTDTRSLSSPGSAGRRRDGDRLSG